MSRSYRKPYGTWVGAPSMKAWRTQENRRLRHNTKVLIDTCEDYDNLVIPVLNDYGGLWCSPCDGRKFLWVVPLLNQCEVDLEEAITRLYRWYGDSRHIKWIDERIEKEKASYTHGGEHCNCYENKRYSSYWKMSRK